MKAMIHERKLDLQVAQTAAMAEATPEVVTQGEAVTRAEAVILGEATQAAVVIREVVVTLGAVAIQEAADILEEVILADPTMAIGTPETTQSYRNRFAQPAQSALP
jgi:hypothetical protein